MARWFHAVRRSDGHSEVIAADPRSDVGFDARAYPLDVWEVTPLAREPGEHDRIEGGRVVKCAFKRAAAARRARAEGMSKADLLERLETLERRVEALALAMEGR